MSRHLRFFAQVELPSGEAVLAHCANPGRMEGLVLPGARVWLSDHNDAKRKLRYTLELVERDGHLIGANTLVPNRFVAALLERRLLPAYRDATGFRAEVRCGEGHRVDFLIAAPGGPELLEVKNCHLVHPDLCGYFPDSVSKRATAHLELLRSVVRSGGAASVLFVVQHPAAASVRPSDVHDPAFAAAARSVARDGVKLRAVRARPSLDGLHFDQEIPVDLEPYATAPIARWRAELAETSGSQRTLPRPA